MKASKRQVKLITVVLTALVMLGLMAGSWFLAVPHTKAASAFIGHNVIVKPTSKALGKLSNFATKNGKVLFPCQSNSNPNPILCYGPDQIRQAYGVKKLLNEHITGKGSAITIIDAYGSPTIQQDLKTFDTTWGLSDPKFNVIAPFGINGSDPGWALESSLDVEWAHVLAPGATINLVVASTNNDIDILNATQYVVDHHIGDVISQSFGENESCVDPALLATEHKVFEAAAKKGISVLASSGDSGSGQLSCDGTTLVQAVSSPASDPMVTAVGGTALTADATYRPVHWRDSLE